MLYRSRREDPDVVNKINTRKRTLAKQLDLNYYAWSHVCPSVGWRNAVFVTCTAVSQSVVSMTLSFVGYGSNN